MAFMGLNHVYHLLPQSHFLITRAPNRDVVKCHFSQSASREQAELNTLKTVSVQFERGAEYLKCISITQGF